MDDLEQYQGRDHIRVFSIEKKKDKDTDSLALELGREKLGINVSKDDQMTVTCLTVASCQPHSRVEVRRQERVDAQQQGAVSKQREEERGNDHGGSSA